MSSSKNLTILVILFSSISVCYSGNVIKGESQPEIMATPAGPDGPNDIVRLNKRLSQFDFDGDKKNEKIWTYYSGGAHCCYQIEIQMSSTGKKYKFPFVLEGGYLGGMNLRFPDKFGIEDFDNDGLPEIYLKIYTNREIVVSIPKEIKKKYKIRTHYILLDFKGAKPFARDFPKQKWKFIK